MNWVNNNCRDARFILGTEATRSIGIPVLILIFLNDIVNTVDFGIFINLFADHVIILYLQVTDNCNGNVFQHFLNEIVIWDDKWLNCILDLIGLTQLQKPIIASRVINSIQQTRFEIFSKLMVSYDLHIDNMMRHAYTRYGRLLTSFVLRDFSLRKQAFITYIRHIGLGLLDQACS